MVNLERAYENFIPVSKTSLSTPANCCTFHSVPCGTASASENSESESERDPLLSVGGSFAGGYVLFTELTGNYSENLLGSFQRQNVVKKLADNRIKLN